MQPLLAHLRDLDLDSPALVDASGMFAQLTSDERSQLLGAFEALEQALGYELGDPQCGELLKAAQQQLERLLKVQPDHAFAQVLLASCLFNRAKLLEGLGDPEGAGEAMAGSREAIGEAWRLRTGLVDRLARLEVEGDYHLLVSGDYAAAVTAYEEITQFSESSPVRPALRAHWMLAGIFGGGWDAAEKADSIVNPEKSREHLVQILAHWPESTEAATIKRYLLWDEQNQRSRTPYLPAGGDLVASHGE
jgi:hypothetical protein